jgi:molybdopterin-binding protein
MNNGPKELSMKISARNVFKGTVKKVNHGVVNSEVTIEIPGGQEIVSVITKSSAEELDLKPGRQAYCIIKATNVIIGVDE